MAKSNQIVMEVRPGDGIEAGMTDSQLYAVMGTRSGLTAGVMPRYMHTSEKVEAGDMLAELKKAGGEVNAGNLGRMERVLVNQALALDCMFSNLAHRARNQEYLSGMETLLRLALKCQAQSRATIEAIGHLKNPAPYIKQANIAQGHQQVNNSFPGAPSNTTPARNSEITPSKLLEAQHGNPLDFGAQAAAGPAHPHLATLAAFERAENPGG